MESIVAETLQAIQALPLPAGRPRIIAIDGRSAAGKSSLAHRLQKALPESSLLHMDQFFLQPQQRTPQRLAQPGGNVDYERFRDQVLLPLTQGRPFSYQPYDCHTQGLLAPISIQPGPLAIVEGSYSCHPALWDFYDLRIFLTVSPAVQLERIAQRNGPAALPMFRDKWIPLEEQYFSALDIMGRCDLCFSTDAQ